MSTKHHDQNSYEEAGHESAFFLSESEERRATMDPLDLLLLLEEADGEDSMEYLLATFTRH